MKFVTRMKPKLITDEANEIEQNQMKKNCFQSFDTVALSQQLYNTALDCKLFMRKDILLILNPIYF